MPLISKNSIGKYERYSDSTELSPRLLNEVERVVEVLDQGPPISFVYFLIQIDGCNSKLMNSCITKTGYPDGTKTFRPSLIRIVKNNEKNFIRFM